ncbi:unnamed protein product [Phytophthora fragariaefolia]|uniref:Unnamed protein product n=1 Tax=Phytophthora fragariaefolia TaxID=1490495 RepID=A0A9W6Y519_9STRA|nr:unnamed protein product [Phytophthora fragariaefolia]
MGGSGANIVGGGEHTLSKGDTRLVNTIGECGKLVFVSPIDILDSSRMGDNARSFDTGVGLVKWYTVDAFKDARFATSSVVNWTDSSLRGLGNTTGKYFSASKSSSMITAHEMMTSSCNIARFQLEAAKMDVIWVINLGGDGPERHRYG